MDESESVKGQARTLGGNSDLRHFAPQHSVYPNNIMLTFEEARSLFFLDEQTGVLYWREKPCRHICIGDIAGYLGTDGYWRIGFRRKLYLRSRLIFLFQNGIWPKEIDHKNGNPIDDRPTNLREATRSQNCANRTSGKLTKRLPKGVWKAKDRPNPFRAEIKCGLVKKRLGSFATPESAHEAYCKAASELHGEFACDRRLVQ